MALHNWPYLKTVWEKAKAENPSYSLTQFSIDNGVDYNACRMAFKRIEKKTNKLRTDRTRSERTGTEHLFQPVSQSEAKNVIDSVCNERVAIIHVEILTRLYRALKRLEEIQDAEKAIEIKTAQDLKHSVSAVSDLVRTLREIMPFILELKDRGNLEEIIGKIQAREYDVTHASLEISKLGVNLPDALRIMLAKTPPIVIENHLESPNMEALDKRAMEAIEHVNWQLECFLPKRGQEVIDLKQELKDVESFSPTKERNAEND